MHMIPFVVLQTRYRFSSAQKPYLSSCSVASWPLPPAWNARHSCMELRKEVLHLS